MAERSNRRGDRRTRSGRGRGGRVSSNLPHPCQQFQLHGSCTFGSRCKFAHDEPKLATPGEKQSAEASRNTTYRHEDKTQYTDWKRFLFRHPLPRESDNVMTLREIWSGALAILNGEGRESQQSLVRDLVDDTRNTFGCQYLHLTLKLKLSDCAQEDLNMIESFLGTITHAAILDSLSIDTYVGNLYNIISGAGGERAVVFFTGLCQMLLAKYAQNAPYGNTERLDSCVSRMLEALYQLLCREKRVSFHDDLPELLHQLKQLVDVLDNSGAVSRHVCASRRDRLDVLCRIVGLSTGLVKATENGKDAQWPSFNAATTASVYPIHMPLPGGRHDNDSMNIADISIIPTAAEVSCEQRDYLPSTDCRQPHFYDDPVQRYFDTHFRLLRHDIFGPFKATLGTLIASLQGGTHSSQLHSGDTSAHLYQDASISHISVDEKKGFDVHITFSLPRHLRQKTADERRRWWENSKQLDTGSLICLLSSDKEVIVPLFLTIGHKSASHKSAKPSDGNDSDPKSNKGNILAKLARSELEDLQLLIQMYEGGFTGVMVALPGLIPATFTPVLKNLQTMVGVGELPFQKWIVPDPNRTTGSGPGPAPPRYSLGPGFTFSLEPIIQGPGNPVFLASEADPGDHELLNTLENQTGLDHGQCRALVCALTREFALIQGPPGTGKTFLGVKLIQVLLASKTVAELGPIIIICYTNHALDQFLEHLIAIGIGKIIRIGGQSRSLELEGRNLRTVSANTPRTRHESYILGSTFSDRERILRSAGKTLGTLHRMRKGFPSAAMTRLVQRRHPRIHSQLTAGAIDGYTLVDTDPLKTWLKSGSGNRKAVSQIQAEGQTADALAARAEEDIDSLLRSERQALEQHWIEEIREEQTEQLFSHMKEYEKLSDRVDSVHREVNRRTLQTADIIGITTTGLAKEIATLQKIRPKVVVCEEAAEVLEAHVISALIPTVQHVIQIGDHEQLRPQINDFSLSMESKQGMLYQLDRSQFERLAVGQPGLPTLPVAQLNIQRRMRPEIASLIRNTMYTGLRDHNSVETLPDVVGMRDNVFWLNHTNMEDTASHEGRVKSHSNEWEVKMTTELVRHLVRQGEYQSTDIAVLTPYSGQLQKLRAALSRDFEICLSDRDEDTLAKDGFNPLDVDDSDAPGMLQNKPLIESLRLATVDNFQGEEAKIIIVSLVRSNKQHKVGFLKTKNRINVLLSRAQHGMYLIGNVDTYTHVPMWADVHKQLDQAGAVGPAFNLCCPRHRDTPIQCAEPGDFARLSPEGGCQLTCDRRLQKCGHRCKTKCHSEAMHAVFSCPQPCPRIRTTCDHTCQNLCGEACGSCLVPLNQVQLPCGHKKDRVRCCDAQKPGNIKCVVEVEKTVPVCGHVVITRCSTDVGSKEFWCPTPCKQVLGCGHVCPGTCGTCNGTARNGGTTHQDCRKTCGKPSNTCSHTCRQRCHVGEACPPCRSPCEMRCAHSHCALKCFESCPPCIERCAWACEHQGHCSMPCGAPCNRLPCDKRCSEVLSCGHQCPGLCGEPCPEKYCQSCGSRPEKRVDLLEFKSYKEIDLDETPIVVLSCGHFFTAESLDGVARLNDVYSLNQNGEFTGFLEPSTLLPVPSCPDCKRPIKQSATQRYNRLINMAVRDETSQRFLVKGWTELESLEKRIEAAIKELEVVGVSSTDKRRLQSNMVTASFRSDRYEELRRLERDAAKFCKNMRIEQQPSKKLFDAIMEAKSRYPVDERLAGLSLEVAQKPDIDKRVTLGGRMAQLKIQAAILADEYDLLSKPETSSTSTYRSPTAFLKNCQAFVEESSANNLPRLAILGSLTYARIAKSSLSACRNRAKYAEKATEHIATAKTLLENAEAMCDSPFDGADQLRKDVEGAQRLLGREWYDPVTDEEIAAIKNALVSGRGGIASHSGHWYKCPNGHTFVIGECGMPMELARCYECGAAVGGSNHTLVSGVSRAMEME